MSDSSLESIISGLKEMPISGHAHAIGHLCLMWSYLESGQNIFVSILAGLKDPDRRAAVIHNAATRDKWKMLDALAFIARPTDEWYHGMKDLINRIDNEIRPERNRMIHDQWRTIDDAIVRHTPMAKIVKEQARKLALKTDDDQAITEDDVWDLVARTAACAGQLLILMDDYRKLSEPSSSDTPSPQSPG